MKGQIRINDIVRYKDEDRLYIVININDIGFQHPDWLWYCDIQAFHGGGALLGVEESNLEVVFSVKDFKRWEQIRLRPEDLPDPRTKFF